MKAPHIGHTAAGPRPNASSDPVLFATKRAMRNLRCRAVELEEERELLDALLDETTMRRAPLLRALYGDGFSSADVLLVAAGNNDHVAPRCGRPEPAMRDSRNVARRWTSLGGLDS